MLYIVLRCLVVVRFFIRFLDMIWCVNYELLFKKGKIEIFYIKNCNIVLYVYMYVEFFLIIGLIDRLVKNIIFM